MTKLFTRTGDDGTTAMIGGTRVMKDSLPIEAVGTVDELNVLLGLAIAQGADESIQSLLLAIQSDLFNMGVDLSGCEMGSQPENTPRIQTVHTERLESSIDKFSGLLPPLTRFILPGGSKSAATLHLARTVCRRAERRAVSLYREKRISADIIRYLNRLSDLLFVLARYQNWKEGISEVQWPME